ncbi:MAG: T9SS type A sorting domain-containing protein, partial [Planctomycetia bacterium]|nr:T9SS type A sorting domain-containing protein [Planctomycetia bacterium]
LQNRGVVKLAIYNLLGKEIITLLNEDREPGKYSVSWNGLNSKEIEMGSGVYIYLLEMDSFKQVRKIILLK